MNPKLRRLLGALAFAIALSVVIDDDVILPYPVPADYCDEQAIWNTWGWYWHVVYILRGCGWPT